MGPKVDCVSQLESIQNVFALPQIQSILGFQNQLLQLVTSGASRDVLLNRLCLMVEEAIPAAVCSILTLEGDGCYLKFGAGPPIPDAFVKDMRGREVLSLKEAFFASNIELHPDWEPYREMAQRYGFRACGSLPLRGMQGEVFGALVVYYKDFHTFLDSELNLLLYLSGLVSLGIENCRREEGLLLFKQAIQNAADSIVITSADLTGPDGPKIVFANPMFSKMTGYSSEEVIGKTPRILQGLRTERSVFDQLKKNLSLGDIFQGEVTHYRKDGTELDLEWTIGGIKNSRGATTHFIAIQRDMARRSKITELRTLEVQFREELLAILVHEIKNPLTALSMVNELFERTHDLKKRSQLVEKLTQTIKSSVVQMTSLTSDFMEMNKLHTDQFRIRPQNVDIEGLVDGVMEIFALTAGTKKIQIRKSLSLHCKSLFCDPVRIHQVLSNLLSNAIKFSDSGKEVMIRTDVEKDGVRFQVQDSGPGIDPEELPHLFHKFWQSKQKENMGRGLGLFVSKQIIQAHGGKIWVESELGSGSSFYFVLGREDC